MSRDIKGQYRQGDVLLIQEDILPARFQEEIKGKELPPTDNNKAVAAYGEVTGHAHFIEAPFASKIETPAGNQYYLIKEETQMIHSGLDGSPGDHRAITKIKPKPHRIIIQEEFNEFDMRQVQD